MAKIALVDTGWSLIPEGKYTFKISEVEYKEDFGKLEVKLVTKNGQSHTERYSLLTANGSYNEGAQKAFSYLAKTALNNWTLDAIARDDLIGCYVSATVEHEESETISEKTGEPFVNARLNNMKSETGFGSDKEVEEDLLEDVEDELDADDIDLDDWLD